MKNFSKIAFLFIGDVLIFYLSLVFALFLRYGEISSETLLQNHLLPFSIIFLVWIVVFYIHDLYNLNSAKNTLSFYTNFLRMLLVDFIIAAAFFYFVPYFAITPKTNLFLFIVVFAVTFALWRQLANNILRRRLYTPTIIIGHDKRALSLATSLNKNPQLGKRVRFVFLKEKIDFPEKFSFQIKTTRDFSELSNLIKKHNVRTIIVDSRSYRSKKMIKELDSLIKDSIEVLELDLFEEELKRKVELEDVDELWFLKHVAQGRRPGYEFLKRVVDILASLILLPIALVISVLTVAVIKLDDNEEIFYTQERVGKNKKPFVMYKFRTMRPDAEKDGVRWTVENDTRITKVGGFLRKTRIDEIPQIINVLKGELSFVGPRAERPEFHQLLKREIPFYERRYLIKPGLTGWAQINYTYGSSVEDTKEKLSYDFYYLKRRSLIFDVGIILKTVNLVLRGLGR